MKKTLGILSALAMSGTAFADVNVSGYVDAGYTWGNKAYKDLNAAGAGLPTANAFAVNEGGVWFTGNSGGSSFVADLDITGVFEQAYVAHKWENGFSMSLGRWDGQLGYESNDSVNRHFINTGILHGLTSSYETGLMLGYDLSDSLGLSFWVVNGDGAVATTTGGTTIDYPGLGFKLTSKMDSMNARVGGHFESANGETGYNIDVGADTKMGDIHVGASLLLTKAPVKDGESGLAFGVEGGTTITEGTTFDLGVEWSNGNQDGAKNELTLLLIQAGPRFMLSDALTIKADYRFWKFGGNAGKDADAVSAVALAGIYKF